MEELLTTDACSLPSTERPLRLAELDALFAETVTRVRRRGGAVRLELSGPPGLRARVQDLTDRESTCCSFFTFTLKAPESPADTDLTLDISVPPAHARILEALAARAEELTS